MKNISSSLASVLLALSLGALNLAAQSPAPLVHASAASGEAAAAIGGSAESTLRTASGAAAIPVWASGAVVQGAGSVARASGAAGTAAGKAATAGADGLWDFASGDAAARPALDRSVGVPPAKPTPPKDPTPAEALRQKM